MVELWVVVEHLALIATCSGTDARNTLILSALSAGTSAISAALGVGGALLLGIFTTLLQADAVIGVHGAVQLS